MIVLFFLPLLLTWDAPARDGATQIGFPLVVYSYGGWCVRLNSCTGFSLKNLIIDSIIIGMTPLVINYVSVKIKDNRS